MHKSDDEQKLHAAFSLHQAGDLDRAARIYREVINKDARNFYALHYLGVVEASRGNLEQAKSLMSRSLSIQPPNIQFVENYATILFQTGDYESAVQMCQQGLELSPNNITFLYVSAISLFLLQKHRESLVQFDKLLLLQPNHLAANNERGSVLGALRKYDDALASVEKALIIQPQYAEAHLNKANIYSALRRYADAIVAYDKALALRPDLAEAWFGRGNVFTHLNLNDKATADFQRALALKPDYAEARFALCFAELPILYAYEEEIISRREAYAHKLRALYDDVDAGRVRGNLVKGIGVRPPFYLAYQGFNDCDLQTLYGSLVCRIMERKYPAVSLPSPPPPDRPVRVGVVSPFFNQHPVWNLLIKGWTSQLDRKRFQIFGYHTGEKCDPETDVASTICDRFVHRNLTVEEWRNEILADAPHVLIYPGLLMDNISTQLAAQRLAPVQCNSWGHPETSGMPTLDYFLTSDLMEPPGAAEHYSERLIRLPNLSICYEPIKTETVTISRDELGLRSNGTIFWCGQSLFKYHPQFDSVFPRIAKETDNCQFVFIQYQFPGAPQINEMFQERLDRAFSVFDLKAAEYCVLLPRLSVNKFIGAIGQCDVYLDSIPWSGGNTTLESLSHNLPIVTMPGTLMRSRHSAAILQMMDIKETIAATIDDYVCIAVRLANHPDERYALSRKIANNKHRLYRDHACISALENFLDRAARQH